MRAIGRGRRAVVCPAGSRDEAARAGMPPEVAEAVAHTESRFNPAAVGAGGESRTTRLSLRTKTKA